MKMTKDIALQLLRSSGLNIAGNITFASENNGAPIYWANPDISFIYNDWWLILNDISHRILHVFFIPANSIRKEKVVLRTDNPPKITYGNNIWR